MTSRRTLLLAIGALLGAPQLARTQKTPDKPARIGVLSSFSRQESAEWHDALQSALRALGWIEGNNLVFEYRFAEGKNERLASLAAEIVALKLDLIVADESTDAQAVKSATRSIPIVMASAGAAVEIGIVDSLARPGGNITGMSQMTPELAGKHLELLREIIPKISRVAVLWNPLGKTSELGWKEMQRSARTMKIQLLSCEIRQPQDFDKAFREIAASRVGALATMPNPVFATNIGRIAAFALSARLPTTFHLREFALAGGLLSYGPNRTEMFRRAAIYVDKILKGARPGDLPIEQPAKFEFVINRKTATALGLKIPQSVLFRVDQLIE